MQRRGQLPASSLRARAASSPPALGQTQTVSNIIAPTRPLGRQSWEWGSSWLAKISGDTLTVTAVAAQAAAESITTGLPRTHLCSTSRTCGQRYLVRVG
jgi:hypothetical protein